MRCGSAPAEPKHQAAPRAWSLLYDPAVLVGTSDGLETRARPELLDHSTNMPADGRVLDLQLRRDRPVVEAICHEVEHFALPRRKPLDRIGERLVAAGSNVERSRSGRRRASVDDSVDHGRSGAVPAKRRYRGEYGPPRLAARPVLDLEVGRLSLNDCRDGIGDRLRDRIFLPAVGVCL